MDRRDLCYAIAKKDPGVCRIQKEESAEDECYYKVALAKKEPTTCEKITGQNLKDKCYTDIKQE